MKNKRTYAFVSLSEIQKKRTDEKATSQQHAENLKNAYLIMKKRGKEFFFIKATFQKFLIFNHKKQVIGYTKFHMQTQLTLESTDAEIKAAIEKFANAHYKQVSIKIYPNLKPVKGLL